MNAQCNSCGGFFGIEKCPTCNTLICERCRTNHENGCAQGQQMKALGLGPTIRTALPSEPIIEFPKNAYSEASAELVKPVNPVVSTEPWGDTGTIHRHEDGLVSLTMPIDESSEVRNMTEEQYKEVCATNFITAAEAEVIPSSVAALDKSLNL
jgi:hypothetical protein